MARKTTSPALTPVWTVTAQHPGLQALLRAMESGDVTVHTVDTTEPSVLARP